MTFIAALLTIYCLRQPHELMSSIWRSPLAEKKAWHKDLGIGVISWLVSFPVVALVGALGDAAIAYFFNVQEYEQVAVRFIKKVAPYPGYLYLILFSVMIAAPLIEEFLFRGCLQNWLKKRLGFTPGLILTALSFALFHMSASQGAGNIPLFLSLLVLGLFLGFLYERQGSLFAPIGLHVAFNALSALRLIASL